MRCRVAMPGLLLLASAMIIGHPALAEPLRTLQGPLLRVDSLLGGTGVGIGRFGIQAEAGGDLREMPRAARLTLGGGGTLRVSQGIPNETRAVDPASGRPLRRGGAVCASGTEGDCLPTDHCLPTPSGPDPSGACDVPVDVRAFRAINRVTAGSASFLDAEVGFLTLPNSLVNLFTGQPAPDPTFEPTLANFASALVAGNLAAGNLAQVAFRVRLPLVVPHRDAGDVTPATGFFALVSGLSSLNRVLSPAQQALFGCGDFYGTDCDVLGMSVLLSEAGAMLQSWPGFHGLGELWDLTDPSVPQPGTVFFDGGPVCTRPDAGGPAKLPGCRGPGEPDHDPGVDGSTQAVNGQPDLIHPFFDPAHPLYRGVDGATPCATASQVFNGCQRFQNEVAALSFNLLMLFVGASSSAVLVGPDPLLLDPSDPFSTERCSLARVQLCFGTQLLRGHVSAELADDPSGPPPRRWLWETGAEYLQTDGSTSALSAFAGWSFHALGPELSRLAAAGESGVLFVLGPPPGVEPPAQSPLILRGPGVDGVVGTDDDPFVGLAYGVGVRPPAPARQRP